MVFVSFASAPRVFALVRTRERRSTRMKVSTLCRACGLLFPLNSCFTIVRSTCRRAHTAQARARRHLGKRATAVPRYSPCLQASPARSRPRGVTSWIDHTRAPRGVPGREKSRLRPPKVFFAQTTASATAAATVTTTATAATAFTASTTAAAAAAAAAADADAAADDANTILPIPPSHPHEPTCHMARTSTKLSLTTVHTRTRSGMAFAEVRRTPCTPRRALLLLVMVLLDCSAGQDSSCSLCGVGFYRPRPGHACTACPEHATCPGGDSGYRPIPDEGYWVATEAYDAEGQHRGAVVECRRGTCKFRDGRKREVLDDLERQRDRDGRRRHRHDR